MKIVQINAVYGFGSTGIIVKDIQSACEKVSIDCVVAYSQSQGEVKNGYHMGNAWSNKLHALLSRISGKQGYFSCLSTWKFLRFLDNYRPDILHLHNLHGCYINVPMLLKYAAKKDIAVVVSLHDCWFYTGGCSHYTRVGCDKWLKECGNCPRRYEEFPALLYDGSTAQLRDRKKLFGAIKKLTAVGVSQWIVDEAQKNIFKNARCLAIHNGIDTDFFHPVPKEEISNHSERLKKLLDQTSGKFVILAPANKWFLDVNRETFDYFASHLTDDMRMAFIGNGVDESRLTDKMINIGFVSSREEIRDIYSACDVMANCTREDSLSLLNVEVQACGTPVVTYSNTGVKETVDGKCGYAVENGNAEEMWKAVCRVKAEGKNQLFDDCVEWCKNGFEKRYNNLLYVELYKEIFNK